MQPSFWRTVVFLGGLLVQLVVAQQYAGDTINTTLPNVPGSEIVYFKIKEPLGKTPKAYNLTLTNYQALQTNGKRIVPSQIQRAVIIIHGLNRDPGTYISNIMSALAQVSDSNVNRSTVALMAPYFPNGDDKNAGYPWAATNPTTGAALKGAAQSYTGALVWQGSQWSGGGSNQYPAAYQTVSSYHVIDQLLQWYGNKTVFPNMKQIVLAGHSLGAQTVQRYAAAGSTAAQLGITVPVTLWIANPNSYVWLNSSRPLSTASCAAYDQWRDGLQNFTGYSSPAVYNSGVTGSVSAMASNYISKSKAYARGLLDTGDDSSGCGPGVSGANRNERFFAFINSFPPSCEAPNTTTSAGHCDTVDFMNIGHDAGSMMASTAGQNRLFIDNFYGNGSRAYDVYYPRVQAGDDPYPNPALANDTNTDTTVYAGNLTSQGCYTDSTGSPSLPYKAYESSSNTIELCTTTCVNAGYTIAGLEYGTQCFCGNALTGSANKVVSSACTMTCPGNTTEICGNNARLNIYANGTPKQLAPPGNPDSVYNANYNYLNCYGEATSGRALSAKSYTDTKNMTLDNCAAYCAGYEYFGIEYSQECYCGSCFNAGSAVISSGTCSQTCTGDATEYCGGSNALSVYQLDPASNLKFINQTCTTGTTTTTAATSTSTVSAASLCPAVNGQNVTDSNNNTYVVTCSSDSSQGSYSSSSASSSYLDCMLACDAASASTGCTGFTYVGAAYGNGAGTCYLKKAMGTYSSAGTNLIAAVMVSGSPSSTATTTSTSTTTTAAAGASSLCPAVNGQNVTDSNGKTYVVTCSSDSSQGSYSSSSASSSYLDCMNACDAASTTGCTGFTYVGAANGNGAGTCYLKKAMGSYSSAGSNLIAAVQIGTGSSSSSTATTTTSGSASATATSSAIACPGSDGQTYNSSSGAQFLIECGIDHNGGDMSSLTVADFAGCINACATTSGCVDVSLSGTACYLKSTLGASVTNSAIWGAKLVSSGSSSSSIASSTTSQSSSSSSSSSVVSSTGSTTSAPVSSSSVVSSSTTTVASSTGASIFPSATATTCPGMDQSSITDSKGAVYNVYCSADSSTTVLSVVTTSSGIYGCATSCDATSGCTAFTYAGDSTMTTGYCYLRTVGARSSAGSTLAVAVQVLPVGSVQVSSSVTSQSTTASSQSSSSQSLTQSSATSSTVSSSTQSPTAQSSSSTSAATSSSSTLSPSAQSSSSTSVSSTVGSSSTVTTSSSSAAATQTKLTCPASDATIYTAASGATFQIECYVDHNGGDMGSKTVNSFEACIEYCASTTGCVDVSLSGVACYIKSSLGAAINNNGVLGAKLISSGSGSTSASSSSTVQTNAAFASSTQSSSTSSVSSSTSSLSSSTSSSSLSSSSLSSSSTDSSSASSSTVTSSSTSSSTVTSSSTSSSSMSSSTDSSSSSTISSSASSSSSSVSQTSFTQSSTATDSSSSSTVSSSSSSSQASSSSSSLSSSSLSSSSLSSSSSSSSFSSTSSVASSTTSSSSSATSSPSVTSSAQSSTTLSSTTKSSTTSTKPTAPATVSSYTYQGCYNDTVSARALKSKTVYGTTSNPMTLENCAASCASYTFFGVEYASECYCANVLSNGSRNGTSVTCSTACPGNSTELCGGSNALQMYSKIASVSSSTSTTLSASSTSSTATSTATGSFRRRSIKGLRGT